MKEGMKRRVQGKLRSKNKATNSTGQATGIINHKQTKTVGTADDPLKYFLGKQLEKFPGFDPDESWRSHPISEDSAVTIMKAGPFSEACTYYSRYDATIYYMPYFLGHISPEEAYQLYGILTRAKQNMEADADRMTPIEQAYEEIGHEAMDTENDRLRFFLSFVLKQQKDRYDVFSDTLNARLIYPVSLARTHEQLLQSWVFDVHDESASQISPPLPTNDEWLLLQRGNYLNKVSTGAYFYGTFKHGDSDRDADADDERIQALAAVLSGGKIAVSTVLKSYVDRLLEEEGGDYFPRFFVASQFAQLCALAQTGFLEANREELTSLCLEPDYLNRDMNSALNQDVADDETTSHAALRDAKLEAFIEQTPAFEHPERRGIFLVGALVGQIGAYQQSSEGRSTTVVDQYSIKSITKHRVKQITQEVLDKNVVYSRENNMQSTMYAEVVDRLVETLASCENEPEDWELSTEDLRFYYALGVTYGMNNWIASDSDSTNSSE
jgi:CRISPR-associated protein Cas8b/Csh1 subtype I-B